MPHHFTARDFSARTRRALSKKGIAVVGSFTAPAGSFASGSRVYHLDVRGERIVRTYSEVEALA